MLAVAVGAATAISATVGTVSMLAGGVVDVARGADVLAHVVARRLLGRARRRRRCARVEPRSPGAAWRRLRTLEGALMVSAVVALGVVAVSIDEPITLRGVPGADLGGVPVRAARRDAGGRRHRRRSRSAITASDVGPFFKQPIDQRTLGTQLYIGSRR